VEFRIFGKVEAINDAGEPVHITPSCRALLAVLLTDLDRPTNKTRLLEIWSKELESDPVDRVIGSLRKIIEANFDERVRLPPLEGQQTRLHIADPDAVDYHRFRRQVSEARADPDDRAAADLLQTAIEETSGAPLAGLTKTFTGPLVIGIRQALDTEYRQACHLHLRRLSALGWRDGSSDLAARYVRRWPGDEQLVKLSIEALAADGRRSDAKAAFAEFASAHGASPGFQKWMQENFVRPTAQQPVAENPVVAPPATEDLDTAPPISSQREMPSELRLLRRYSQLMAYDMDVVGIAPVGDGTVRRLSEGLHVERLRYTADILDLLTGPGQERILIAGEAGIGKTTMLWDLYHQLGKLHGVEPLLVNSAWLTTSSSLAPDSDRVVTAEQVVRAADAVRLSGDTAVILLDTADLLLHGVADRIATESLCTMLDDAAARIVIACRPREAALLSRDRRKTFDLERYDNAELRVAVTNYARVYCPDAAPRDPAARAERIMNAVARSLPVHEICRSPLHLRMLFELYDDEFPMSELDISGLYDRYRKHKVQTDQRTEVGFATGEDLSIAVEQCAVAFLVHGKPELEETELLQAAAAIGAGWPVQASIGLATAVEHLLRRSVLSREGKVLKFNHQTLFEYFAAWGLITRDGQHAADRLVEHMRSNPADLFAGAVLEQVLVLLARQPQYEAAVRGAVDTLITAGGSSLPSIGLMVLAHHPNLKELPTDVLKAVGPAAVRRYVYIVPAVVQKRLPELFGQLRSVWEMKNDECRQAVLEAVERLAAQAPDEVVTFLRNARCANYVIKDRPDIFPTHHVLPRTYAAVATVAPKYAGGQLARFYRVASERSHGRDLCVLILRLVAESWEHIRDGRLLRKFLDLVPQGQEEKDRDAGAIREALGQLVAAHWWFDEDFSLHRDWRGGAEHPWLTHVREVRGRVEVNDEDAIAAAELVGIAFVLARLEPEHRVIEPTIDLLVGMAPPRAPHQLSRGPFPLLLRIGGPAADALARRVAAMLESLPAPANRPQPGPEMWAAVARAALVNAELTPAGITAVLAGVKVARDVGLWLRPDGLVAFLIPASIAGHSTAQAALDTLKTRPADLPRQPRELVSSAIRAHLRTAPHLFPLLVELAKDDGAKHITEAIKALGLRAYPVLMAHGDGLMPIFDRLLAGNGGQQRTAVNLWQALENAGYRVKRSWDEMLGSLRHATDPRAKANLFTLLGKWVSRDAAPFGPARTLLSSYVAVAGDPPQLTPTFRSQDDGVVQAARSALIQVLATRADPARGDVDEVRRLASAAPTDSGVFALAGTAATTLADSGRTRAAAELVLNLMEDAIRIGLSDNVLETLANRLRRPVVLVFRKARSSEKRWLLAQVETTQEILGRIIVNAAAQEAYQELKDDLRALSTRSLRSRLAKQIEDDLRAKARTDGSNPLPVLGHPWSPAEPMP
jgi:DNA-binding SARP family transcriptional activator